VSGGKASGVMPVIKDHINAMRHIAQGTARRGAWACYLDIEHGDFNEVVDYLSAEPDDFNLGWTIKQSFIDRLNKNDTEAVTRFKRAMKVKMVTGKGYFFFIDKANAKRPQMYIDKKMFINNSQLCSEIMLFNDHEHTYTCVLSSMNAAKYKEWGILLLYFGLLYSSIALLKSLLRKLKVSVVWKKLYVLPRNLEH